MGKGRKRVSSRFNEEVEGHSSKRARVRSSQALSASPGEGGIEPDETSLQLSQERARALEILESVLKDSGVSKCPKKCKSVDADDNINIHDLDLGSPDDVKSKSKSTNLHHSHGKTTRSREKRKKRKSVHHESDILQSETAACAGQGDMRHRKGKTENMKEGIDLQDQEEFSGEDLGDKEEASESLDDKEGEASKDLQDEEKATNGGLVNEEASEENAANGSKDREDGLEQQFYDVRKDLKELFNSIGKSGGGFSFLGEDHVEYFQDGHTQEEEDQKSSPTEMLPHEEEKECVKYFFFHCDNDVLRNRIDENSFVRAQPLEELKAEWPDRRTAMKHSFRKRHKEALKAGKRRYVTKTEERN